MLIVLETIIVHTFNTAFHKKLHIAHSVIIPNIFSTNNPPHNPHQPAHSPQFP